MYQQILVRRLRSFSPNARTSTQPWLAAAKALRRDSYLDDGPEIELDARAQVARQRRVLVFVLVINVLMFAMMGAASYLSRSSALYSGTLDNFGDAVTCALSFAVVGASAKAKARVALFKGIMILSAAGGVALQITWRIAHPDVPNVGTMGAASVLNLLANLLCLRLLAPHRANDLSLESAWECSRNDVLEGMVVVLASTAIWAIGSGWPDVLAATILLLVILRSAVRVLWSACRALGSVTQPRRTPSVNRQ